MKKFNVKTIEKQLLEINEKHGISTKVAVQNLVNALSMYNETLEKYVHQDETHLVYILYQMSGSINKMLKEFKILPSSIKMVDTKDEDKFNDFKNKHLKVVKKTSVN
jgi:hypothetical protein